MYPSGARQRLYVGGTSRRKIVDSLAEAVEQLNRSCGSIAMPKLGRRLLGQYNPHSHFCTTHNPLRSFLDSNTIGCSAEMLYALEDTSTSGELFWGNR